MIPELAAQYAARASGAAISETSIKEITCVLNGRTQRSHRAILLSRPLLDPRTHDEIARVPAGKEKTALLSGTRFQCDAENSETRRLRIHAGDSGTTPARGACRT
jgi:hypothetical protein